MATDKGMTGHRFTGAAVLVFCLSLVCRGEAAVPAGGGERQDPGTRTIRDQPGCPAVFEVDIGECYTVRRQVGGRTIERTIKLISVEEVWQPDYWVEPNPDHRTLASARVVVQVSGVRATLLHRPYQMPIEVNGLRLYVETTRRWARTDFAPIPGVKGAVRLSAAAAGEGWGRAPMVFCIGNYRWRASSYNNTWSALVPYNKLYYHRGEDPGAIPGHLPVLSMMDGRVVVSPLPNGDGASNGVAIESASGLTIRYAHMDIESIDPSLTVGAEVKAGGVLGRTGMTWAGRRSQVNGPHLHLGFHFKETLLASYPFFVEAYLASYPDPLLPVAGGYYFAVPGQELELDGSRSIARPGKRIDSYVWRLHDGRAVKGPAARMKYESPGLYSEELTIRTTDGCEDRGYAQVRVFDPKRGRNIAGGWVHYTPVRGVRPGTEVLFWNRLRNTVGPATIDFGDGSPCQTIGKELRHTFKAPGLYVVTFTSRGPANEPVAVRTRVVVEPPATLEKSW